MVLAERGLEVRCFVHVFDCSEKRSDSPALIYLTDSWLPVIHVVAVDSCGFIFNRHCHRTSDNVSVGGISGRSGNRKVRNLSRASDYSMAVLWRLMST